jgi:NADH-quinone oxidoreductase subunit H
MIDLPFILNFLLMCVKAAVLLGFISISVMFLIWWERKISAHIQSRLGPMIVGWHGCLQTIADTIKLLLKENIVCREADKLTFWLAPLVVFVASFLPFVAIPFGKNLIVQDLPLGLLYILAVSSLGVIGIFMAGWGSGNKYSLLGGMRTAAQIISYEIPLVLSVLTIVMMTKSMNMNKIIEAQKEVWFIVYQPIAFLIYFISAIAEVNRAPFDIAEAESELVAGFHTEYSGMKFSMFFLAEYTNMFVVAVIATTLFLGGWQGPFLPGIAWFLIKAYFLIFLMMWIRWTFPRLRVDQLMSFAWKFLMPLAFLNILVTALVMVVKQ